MTDVFAPLARIRAYQVTELWRPQHPAGHPTAGRDRAQRAALTAAYHAGLADPRGGTIAFGWIRAQTGGPVHVLAAGDALSGSVDARAGEALLALPSGARGAVLRKAELAWLTGQLGCWREVAGISDPLLADGAAGRPGSGLDDGLLGNWAGPFGWLVIAEPLNRAGIQALAEDAGSRRRAAEGTAGRFPGQAALARRLDERQAELQRSESDGLWRVAVWAGGADDAGAARVAGLLCASADLDGLPYRLTPAPAPPGGPQGPGGDATPSSPFCASTELLAALARPPEAEMPGVRLALRPEFDVTPELPAPVRGFEIGRILDRSLAPAGVFALPEESLNRHVLVCGATGGGKSQTVRALLEAATAQKIPWLVVEPAKAEYRLMASRIPGAQVIRIRPGEPDAVAAGLNPLEPAVAADGARFPLQTHADLVKALFTASFQAEEPFPQVLSAALTRAYEHAGWDLALGEPRHPGTEPAYPTLGGLQQAAEQVVAGIGYSQRVTDDVLGFVRVRLASLRHGTAGRFLEEGHRLDFAALLRANVVLELEDVGDDADKAFLMGAVLIRLAEQLRLGRRPAAGQALRHLTVIEEAHRLLRRPAPGGGAAGHAVELFAGLLAEVRAYGEGLVIAEQIPARLVPDVIKNSAVKIVHRLPAADDREAVGAAINATGAQARYLATLPPGRAGAFADGMDFPILIQVKDGTARERPEPGADDPRSLVTPRFAGCGPQCHGRPCTLRETRRAQHALDGQRWVSGWAALAVLAHLTGWPIAIPKPRTLAALQALPLRESQCTIAHAADAAAAAHPAIPRPAALAEHVSAALRAWAEDAQWLCTDEEPGWLASSPAVLADMSGRLLGLVAEGRPDTLPDRLESFIDCRWPVDYLPPSPPPA